MNKIQIHSPFVESESDVDLACTCVNIVAGNFHSETRSLTCIYAINFLFVASNLSKNIEY